MYWAMRQNVSHLYSVETSLSQSCGTFSFFSFFFLKKSTKPTCYLDLTWQYIDVGEQLLFTTSTSDNF